jgi:hypothetical protein
MKQTQKIFLTLTMTMIVLTVSAQETAFGIKGGINLSTLNLKDADASYNSRTGFHAGIFMRARTGNVGFQPEVLLFTQNGDIKSSAFGTAQDRFTYLSIPVMLKFYPIGGFNFQVGPQFGFLIAGERKYDTFVGNGSKDIKDYYKSSDVSVSLGLGYDFGFGLGLDARYNLGVKDINNASNGDPVKSRVFLLSLGWNFLR